MEEITKITKTFSIPGESFEEIRKSIKDVSDFKKEIEGAPKENLSKLLETILGGGVALDVSDIHVEPGENDAKIRIRIDGMLQDAAVIDSETYQGLLSRIKLLSEIKLNISDRPQDGRFSILATVDGKEISIEVRCSSLPSEHGESIVLRILNPKSLINLKNLGLRSDLFPLFTLS
jgi:type IV pilus assembly protein PilB